MNEPPVLEPAPAELTDGCPRPIALPERTLTEAEVIEFWARDRAALLDCGMTKDALLRYYQNRDALLNPGPL